MYALSRNLVLLSALQIATSIAAVHQLDKVERQEKIEPCATLSNLWVEMVTTDPTKMPLIEAQLVHDCIITVPLNKTEALALVDGYAPYVEWHSTLAYLKDPPAGYPFPPIDVLDRLATIRANVENDKYEGEHAFQIDLFQITLDVHDGHFSFVPDLVAYAFGWIRDLPIVSISSDGQELPKVFSYEDVKNSPSTAAALLKINGQETSAFLEDLALSTSEFRDVDTAYNSMFYSLAGNVLNRPGSFSLEGRNERLYQGPNTTYTWDNGTTTVRTNLARVFGNLTGITDGSSFYQRFCVSANRLPTFDPEFVQLSNATVLEGYPQSLASTTEGHFAGYFLDGPGFDEVAVLSFFGFDQKTTEIQPALQDFLAQSVAANKTKLVVDLSANSGGTIMTMIEVFHQLFPSSQQSDYSRVRESDIFMALAKTWDRVIGTDLDLETAPADTIYSYIAPYSWHVDLNVTLQPFTSFEEKLAPHVYAGDSFTNIMRYDLNDPLITSNATFGAGIEITGFGSRKDFKQPFKAEDIIVIYDGRCQSSCQTIGTFLKTDAGVKSIAMGARPHRDLITGAGGTRGQQSFRLYDIKTEVDSALVYATPEEAQIYNRYTQVPMDRGYNMFVNYKDSITPDHLEDGIPAQFINENADCKLFWTLPMITDVTKVWEAAATTAWGDGKCVAGSLG